MIARGEDDIESDVFLVGLSKCVRSSAEKTDKRRAKRPRNWGTSIHLGPITNPVSTSATRVFKEVTGWTKFPPTARCLSWVDNLPDWLEVDISGEDAEEFEELWNQRPAYLRETVCMVYKAA